MGSGGSNQSGGGGGGGAEQGGATQPPQDVPKHTGSTDGKDHSKIYDEDPTVNPGGQLVGEGGLVENMPKEVQDSIVAYTGGEVTGGARFGRMSAEELNRVLRDPEFRESLGRLDPARLKIADAYQKELNRSLDRLRSYKGEVYRTIDDATGNIAKKFEPGRPYKFDEFLSTSRSTNPSYKPFADARRGQTRFKIEATGKGGKWVEKISEFTPEREVLFKSGSRFMVTSRKFNAQRGTWDISLREI